MQAYNGSLTQAGLSYKNALSIMILMLFTQAGLSYTNSSTPMLLPMSLADVQRLASTSQVTKLMMMEIFDKDDMTHHNSDNIERLTIVKR